MGKFQANSLANIEKGPCLRLPHRHGFFPQEWTQGRHHAQPGHSPRHGAGGAGIGALPSSVQKENQEKESVSHCREAGANDQRGKININPATLYSPGLLSGTET